MLKYLLQIWNSKDLRKKIIFTISIIILFRIATHITLPGVNLTSLRAVFEKNQILGIFSLLTGGSAENFSIVLMGLSPYINASIIMQLLTVVVPKLEALKNEGQQGYRTINKYTRWLTLPISFMQSYGMILLINSQAPVPIIEDIKNPLIILPIMFTVTTGTIFLVWLGELISERGIGNGISLIIFAGIMANIPTIVGQTLAISQQQSEKLIPFAALILITVILTVFVILITEGHRKIPITYAGRGIQPKGQQASLPIRINQAGMIPIIFAVSMVSFPSIFAQLFLVNAKSLWLQNIGTFININMQMSSPAYLTMYFLLIIAFTYFYVSITFNPQQVAENIQKRGGFIPGIRPGKQTAEYLGQISHRLNLFGGLFIALVAVAPILIQRLLSGSTYGSVPLLISGAGMIIIVGVVLELMRQINAQLVMHDYDKLY